MALIEIRNLTKKFGNLTALDDVALEINSGEIFGFLGPNGAGKSTTIRCMLGFIYPNLGKITINGHSVSNKSSKHLEDIGFVSSDLELNEKWTGKAHIDFLMKARGSKDFPNELIERLGFNVEPKVKQLSSGNKQKLAFILAMIDSPKLLLLDEPTKGLDPLLQETIYKILTEFRDAGGCVFFSSHNLGEVERICDRIGIIKKGKIVANETMESLQGKHIHIIKAVFSDPSNVPDMNQFGEVESPLENQITLKVEGDINPALRKLSEFDLADISIEHASLEDIFLHFYEED